jgi:hypothetical protein
MKTLTILVVALLMSACSSNPNQQFFDEAELFNRASAMYCDDKGVRTYMQGNRGILFIVCKDGTRFTINGGI